MGGCLPRGLQGLQRPCKAPCWPGWSSGARCASWWPPGSGGASSGGAAAPVLSTALWEATGCRVSDYLAAPWEFQKETSGRSVLMRPDVLSTCGRWGYVDVAARMTHGCRFLTAGQLARASELAPQVGRTGFLFRNALSNLRSERAVWSGAPVRFAAIFVPRHKLSFVRTRRRKTTMLLYVRIILLVWCDRWIGCRSRDTSQPLESRPKTWLSSTSPSGQCLWVVHILTSVHACSGYHQV